MAAMGDWIFAIACTPAEEVTEPEDPNVIFELAQHKLDPMFLLPGLARLKRERMLAP